MKSGEKVLKKVWMCARGRYVWYLSSYLLQNAN